MVKEHILLVSVETLDKEAFKSFTDTLYFDMDVPGAYVRIVKEIRC